MAMPVTVVAIIPVTVNTPMVPITVVKEKGPDSTSDTKGNPRDIAGIIPGGI
jgi:hypothetical protein